MKLRIFIVIASVIMILVGLLRGIGGILLLINGNNIDVAPPVSANSLVSRLCGIGLLIVFLTFSISAFYLLKYKCKNGWMLAWIGIAIFLLGGLINGYLLFGT